MTPEQLAAAIDEMAVNPKGGKMAAVAYKHCARLIREKLAEDTLYRELAAQAEDIAFWKFQAFWHRAQHKGIDVDRRDHWKELEADFERIRVEENKDRYSAEAPREIGS